MKNLLALFMLSLTSAVAISEDLYLLAGRRNHGHILIARGSPKQVSSTKDNRSQQKRPSSPSSKGDQLSLLSKSQNPLITAVSGAPRSLAQSPSSPTTSQGLATLVTEPVTKSPSKSHGSLSSSSEDRQSRLRAATVSIGASPQSGYLIATHHQRFQSKAHIGPDGFPMLPLNQLPLAMQQEVKNRAQPGGHLRFMDRNQLDASRRQASPAKRLSDSAPLHAGSRDNSQRISLLKELAAARSAKYGPQQHDQQIQPISEEPRQINVGEKQTSDRDHRKRKEREDTEEVGKRKGGLWRKIES